MLVIGTTKTVLSNVRGHFDLGKLAAILGPSGAGKTTLLKIISGKRLSNIKGTMAINGIEGKKGRLGTQICYVPQEFALLPFLTTKETLYMATRLKSDADQTEQSTYLIVNEIAMKLGLLDCLDTMANKLSGGERKRLSIGVEIVTKPYVLLLDEPTSGLDSAASNQLINVLHNMARTNCTVVCTIHQPSSQMFTQFDDVMVLAKGKCMYCGPQNEILSIFDTAGYVCPQFYNIAEFVLEVITEQRGGDLDNLFQICYTTYKKSRHRFENYEKEASSSTTDKCLERNNVLTFTNDTKVLSAWQQQKILFVRALISIKRDSIMTKLRFVVHIIVALLLGAVFYDFGNDAQKVTSNISCLFFWLLFLFFSNAMSMVQMIPTEAAVFLQEHLNNWYHLKSYYIVKVLTDLPMQILCSSTFFAISYYITGQPMEYDRILKTWSVCVSITILGQTVGILMGTAFNVQIGTFLIPALSIPLMLFAGFFLKFEEMSIYLKPLGIVSFFRYGFEGMVQAIYSNRSKLLCLEIYCHLRSPSTILSMMNMPTTSFHNILIILGCWIFCLHILTYGVLCWKIYYARK